MSGDLNERIEESQGKIERLISGIPGYKGYKQKEQRREADKLLRLHIARQFDEQLLRMNAITRKLSYRGKLSDITMADRAANKLQLLIDRIKNASMGYSGLFDAIKVREEELDKLYNFDLAMLDGVSRVAELIDQIEQHYASELPIAEPVDLLIAELEAQNATFSTRQDVILA
ncbi:MAG: hypothetical protein GXY52_05850 [Chloroflexi bacterium]|nr:hypothetical protein [Chloroflexota bacterium]